MLRGVRNYAHVTRRHVRARPIPYRGRALYGKYDPLYLTLNDKPQAILQVIDGLHAAKDAPVAGHGSRRRLPWLLVLIGVVLFALDFTVDRYGGHILLLPAIGSLVAAVVLCDCALARPVRANCRRGWLWRARSIYTLRDDIDPKRTFAGLVDLRGADVESKLPSHGKNRLGFPVDYYRDEWLGLKLKLYDGNVLRLAVVERRRCAGYYKRSASGKQKWKAPKSAAAQEIKLKLAINPAVYEWSLKEHLRPGNAIGPFQVSSFAATNGVLAVSAQSDQPEVGAADMLDGHAAGVRLVARKAEA